MLCVFSLTFFSAAAQQDSVPHTTVVSDSVTVLLTDTTFSSKDSIYTEKGIASWYGKKFEGRRTYSGKRFHADSLTAAHKTLPMGTVVKVTNLKNDSVVIVRINDRLPKSSKRSIDLSYGAAKKLNFIRAGLTEVLIEEIRKQTPQKPD
ncbi:MAG: hypothetical protein Fur0041_10190 [Bacteroidia bacterium]